MAAASAASATGSVDGGAPSEDSGLASSACRPRRGSASDFARHQQPQAAVRRDCGRAVRQPSRSRPRRVSSLPAASATRACAGRPRRRQRQRDRDAERLDARDVERHRPRQLDAVPAFAVGSRGGGQLRSARRGPRQAPLILHLQDDVPSGWSSACTAPLIIGRQRPSAAARLAGLRRPVAPCRRAAAAPRAAPPRRRETPDRWRARRATASSRRASPRRSAR